MCWEFSGPSQVGCFSRFKVKAQRIEKSRRSFKKREEGVQINSISDGKEKTFRSRVSPAVEGARGGKKGGDGGRGGGESFPGFSRFINHSVSAGRRTN